jgi:hypothetical protein
VQDGLVARVGERVEDLLLQVGRVGEQRPRLVGVGGEHDPVEGPEVVGVVVDLDAVGLAGHPAHRDADPDRGERRSEPVHVRAGAADHGRPRVPPGDREQPVVVEEREEVAGRVAQGVGVTGGPHAGDERERVVPDEVRAEAAVGEELTERGEVVRAGLGQVATGAAVEPFDLREHGQEPGARRAARLGEHSAGPPAAGVLQAAALAADAHAHLGRRDLDPELGEQLAKLGVGAVVVHDEAGVDADLGATAPRQVVGVGVPAEPVLAFVERDVVSPLEQVRGGEPGHPGAHDRHGRTPGAALRALGAHGACSPSGCRSDCRGGPVTAGGSGGTAGPVPLRMRLTWSRRWA